MGGSSDSESREVGRMDEVEEMRRKARTKGGEDFFICSSGGDNLTHEPTTPRTHEVITTPFTVRFTFWCIPHQTVSVRMRFKPPLRFLIARHAARICYTTNAVYDENLRTVRL